MSVMTCQAQRNSAKYCINSVQFRIKGGGFVMGKAQTGGLPCCIFLLFHPSRTIFLSINREVKGAKSLNFLWHLETLKEFNQIRISPKMRQVDACNNRESYCFLTQVPKISNEGKRHRRSANALLLTEKIEFAHSIDHFSLCFKENIIPISIRSDCFQNRALVYFLANSSCCNP